MRLLHTSDWHLGQTLHDFERHYEHQQFLQWLLSTLREQAIDVLLIAGDVFDNSNPSAVAQASWYQFLQQARQQMPQLQIVVIAGNHDSAARLEAPAPLLQAMQIHVVGQVAYTQDGELLLDKLVIPLYGSDGMVAAWALAIPFLRPGDVPRVREVESGVEPFVQGVATLYQAAYEHACQQAQAMGKEHAAIIALGHCHMTGGELSRDSERNIMIGGSEALPAAVFPEGLAYAALGHLHKAQRVAQCEHWRYSGSPLPLSFAEIDYQHQVLCLELDGAGPAKVSAIAVPRSVALLRVPRQPAPLEQVLQELASLELASDTPLERQPYLQVRVLLDAPQPGLRGQIEAAIEGRGLRLAKIDTVSSRSLNQADADAEIHSLDDLQRLQADQIFARIYQQRYGQEVPAEQLAAFRSLQLQAQVSQ